MKTLSHFRGKFLPFTINIVDIAEITSAILLVITGNNIAQMDPVLSIVTLCAYSANKKFIEIAKSKMSITPNPDPAGKLPAVPLPAEAETP